MRIITGTARGKKLKTPANYDIRPTTDNVKESVFNIIQFDIEGRRVLDLFAGTGQLGIECLSRGAAEAVFVDESREAVRIVRENLKSCGLQGQVLQEDALVYLRRCGKFDLIFIDPPYDAQLYEPVLNTINLVDILSDGGIIICEARREKELPELRAPYRKGKEYRYGKVKICIYKKESNTDENRYLPWEL
ncbi:MAG: 16S rRNA (guanine(966)-N(2))-methyltransferase RsmD [Oscillospiraceae bacterium]|nr:16S rRNA (guanine(966)-N(2))-methyltransferase RsmD [Oscillospiraceae bacterium]